MQEIHMILFKSNQNQIFHYTRCNTPKCVMSLVPISALLRLGNTAHLEEMSQRWQTVGNTVFNLTGPRFEP